MSATPAARQQLDVVFTYSFDTWGDAVYRGMNRPPDRLVTTLMRHPDVSRLLVANPFRSAPVRALRSVLRLGEAPFPSDDRHRLHTPLRVRRSDPTDVGRLRRTYARYDASLGRAAARSGMTRPAVITTHPLVAGFSALEWASSCCFYVRDDWSQLPARRPWWPAYRAAFRDVAASGRPVAAVSQVILDRLEPTGPAAVVPNGIEPGEWAGPAPAEPSWFAAVPGPRLVYVGTLDSRLDVEGVLALARARPDLHQVLVGAVGEPDHVAPLMDVPNIHVHRHVGRQEVVAVLRAADACLIPHQRTALTEAMSPLKLYEYLAAGRPVLAVDLLPVRGLGPRVVLTGSAADFTDVVDAALAMGPAPEAERQAFLERHSWRAAHEAILDLVRP